MTGRVIPEVANRQDWPRLVSGAHKELSGRVSALETPVRLVLTPETLPASGAVGELRCDSADSKIKAWDGSAWQPLW